MPSPDAPSTASSTPLAPVPLPVIRATRPGPHGIELVIAVGQQDEPPQLAGITHLAEHLLIRLAGVDATFKDGVTGLATVSFSATGTAETCLDFARRLCTAVADVDLLTDEQLALELRIVESEDPLRFHETIPSLWTIRHGLQGAGLFGAGTSTVGTLTRDEVVAWVRTWFTGDHAVVVLTGPWADDVAPGLALPPAAGGRVRRRAAPSGLSLPVAVPTSLGGTALSVLVPADLGPSLAHAAQQRFFTEVRHDAGLAYVVDVQTDRVDADTVQLDVVVGASTERAREAAEALVRAARDVAEHGFGDQAVARARLTASVTLVDEDARVGIVAEDAVRAALLGNPAEDFVAELRAEQSIDDETLRTAWARALETAVVMVDEDADLGDTDEFGEAIGMRWDDLAPAVEVSPREVARAARGHRRWRNALLRPLASDWGAVTDEQVLIKSGDRAWTVALADVAVAVASDGEVVLVMRDGRRLRVEADGWLRGASFVSAVEAAMTRIAPERLRRVPTPAEEQERPGA